MNFTKYKIHLTFLGNQVTLREMKTDFPFINDFAVFSDGTVAVCGGKKIKCYNFETGKILSSTEMGLSPFAMAGTKFRGRATLVVSYR